MMAVTKLLTVAFILCWLSWIAFSFPFSSHGGRIIGGNKAKPGQFPFIVSLNQNSDNPDHHCAASIINKKWLVTAAHCMLDAPTDLYVVESDTVSLFSGVIHNITSIIMHENYNDNTITDDIALIQIKDEFTLSDTARIIEIDNAAPNETCTVIGWGKTETEDSPVDLYYITLKALSDDDCARLAEGGDYNLERGPGQICALGGKGIAPCGGDSGGPLVCHDKLIGIVSYGIEPCAEGYPDVYTKAVYYVDWINNVTGGIL